MPELLRRFSSEWPEVRIRPTEAAGSDLDLYQAVERGALELSFVELPAPDGPFETVELLTDPYVLVIRPDSPLARGRFGLTDLAGVPLVGRPSCRGLARVEAQLLARGVEPEFAFLSTVNATIQALAGAGVGAAVLPGAQRRPSQRDDRDARPCPAFRPASWRSPLATATASTHRPRRRSSRSRRPSAPRSPRRAGARGWADELRRPAPLPSSRCGSRGPRLGAGGERLALVAVGIVAGSAAIAAVLGGRLVMQDRARLPRQPPRCPRPIARLHRRLVRRLHGGNWRPLDREVSNELVALTGREPARLPMLYREASVGGRFINLRGAVDLGRLRPPRVRAAAEAPCTPTYCEVLRIRGTAPDPVEARRSGWSRSGRATSRSERAVRLVFIQPATTGIVSAAVQKYRPQPAPVVLAEGVDGLSRTPRAVVVLPRLRLVPAGEAWGRAPVRSVAAYTRQVNDVRAELGPRAPTASR